MGQKFSKKWVKIQSKRKYSHYPYDKDVCYFKEAQVSKIIEELKRFDDKFITDISDEDRTIIFDSLNKMKLLSKLIKEMKKYGERYKTHTRDKPIINSLIRLINENNDKEFTNKLLDELAGYTDDYSNEIKGFEVIRDYHNIINYRVKKLNPKPYNEIVFNKVVFNKDVLTQKKKEYNKCYQMIFDIYKKYSKHNFNDNLELIVNGAKLHKKYQLC